MANKNKVGEKLKPKGGAVIAATVAAVEKAANEPAKKGRSAAPSKDRPATAVLICACTNAFQDKTYGLQKRVHNASPKGYGCTVCGSVRGVSSVSL